MRWTPRRARLSSLALAAAVALAAGLGAEAFSTGNAAAARTGCGPQVGCHGAPGLASPLVVAVLEGLPGAYTPGAAYALVVSIAGGPPALPNAENQGGFGLEATAGSLAAADGMAQADGLLATHTETGNDQRSWNLNWTAPAPGAGEVQFFLSVNAVNGNGLPDPGDQWSSAAYTTTEGEAPPPPAAAPANDTQAPPPPAQRTPGPAGALVLGLLGLLALAAAAPRRPRP